MTTTVNSNIITGIIEHRGNAVIAKVPITLLTLDTLSFAIERAEALRLEALDPDYTTEERSTFLNRASTLDAWMDGGCNGNVSLGVDFTLYQRCALKPAVVMHHNLDAYLDQLLAASEIVPANAQDAPAFAFRNNAGEAELWLTDARALRNARCFPGPDVVVVDTTVSALKDIIAIYTLSTICHTATVCLA